MDKIRQFVLLGHDLAPLEIASYMGQQPLEFVLLHIFNFAKKVAEIQLPKVAETKTRESLV